MSSSRPLDNASGIHDADAVRQTGDDGKVVRDPDHRRARLATELLGFVEDLPLDGDVERRRRFVRDNQVRLVQQRNRDGDALAHAAGELVRIGPEALVRRGDADLAERVARHGAGVLFRHCAVREHRLDHLRLDAQHRIEGHHRVLEDHRDAVAAQVAHPLAVQPNEVLTIVEDAALHHPARRVHQPDDREASDGLAGTRFADKPHDFAPPDLEANPVHSLDDAGLGEEMRFQALDGQGGVRRGHSYFCNRGFRMSRSWSPTRLIDTMVTSRATPG